LIFREKNFREPINLADQVGSKAKAKGVRKGKERERELAEY
jgi:hypothetical protein